MTVLKRGKLLLSQRVLVKTATVSEKSRSFQSRGNEPVCFFIIYARDLFCESPLTIQCTLGNKIKATTLVDTCATGFGFINEKFAEIVCERLEIQPQRLTKPKPIQGFDGRTARPMTYAIYPTLSVGNHTESLAPLLITKLGQHPIILGRPWRKKHGALLDMIHDFIIFSPGFCTHLGAPLSPISPKPIEETRTISEAKQQQNITPNRIFQRGSVENLDNFLKTIEKISKKKRRLANAFKRKLSMGKQKPKTVVISSLDNSHKEDSPISILAPILGTDVVHVAIIGADAYRLACKLKGAQVFAVSMKDLEFQAEKKARPETDPKSVVPEEYHDLLDVFSKKDLDTLPHHQKYDIFFFFFKFN